MLPAFVIGLREGLESVVIIGAIALFLRAQGRTDLLPRIWRAIALATVICVGIGFLIRYVELNLPFRQEERFETIVGLAAVLMVTYMVVWMRRFPKDLRHDSNTAAAAALARDSGRALVALAFFAILREGFEIAVFVVATIGLTGRSAWLSTGGAFLGVVVALAVGIGVVRGTTHLDVSKFFRVTALFLVLSAAGIAMSTVHTANAAGWITFGQTPQFDLSWIAPPGSVLSSFTTGMFGLQPYPVLIEVVAWLAYFVPMMAVVLWPSRSSGRAPAVGSDVPGSEVEGPGRPVHRRPTSARSRLGAVAALAIGVVVYWAPWLSTPAHVAVKTHVTKRVKKPVPLGHLVLFATLDDVTCLTVDHCIAVGDFLPLDKDAASGDPDGDGQATHTLVESSAGQHWRLLRSPDKGRGGAVLSSVSCPTADECVAVGFYREAAFGALTKSAPPDDPLIEAYDRGTWRIVAGPNVAPNSVLVSVSCPTSTACTAVGYTTRLVGENPVETFFVEHYDGRNWTVAPLSPPPGTSSGLNSVSCPDVSTCVAVGEVAPINDVTSTRPLIETFADGAWTSATPPVPGTEGGILYEVRCVSVGSCVAVGNAVTGGTTGSALVLSSTGSTWTADPAAMRQAGDLSLTALGCGGETDCVVAGISLASGQRVAARTYGSGWRELGLPAASENIQGIACVGSSQCLAVGSVAVDELGNTMTLIAALSGDTWTDEQGPIP